MDILDCFAGLVSTPRNEAPTYILQHPVLLLPSRWDAIEDWIGGRRGAERDEAARYLQILKALHRNFSSDPPEHPYPFGLGPVETLWKQVGDEEISIDAALRRAASPEVCTLLSPIYVRILSGGAKGHARTTDWRAAVTLMRILLAALDARARDSDSDEMENAAVRNWLMVVFWAVADVPDGRLFSDAVDRAGRLEKTLEAAADRAALWSLNQDLGALHLDPYTHGRNSSNYEAQYEAWQQRLEDEYGRTGVAVAGDAIRMPAPKDAFATAADHMRRAADLADNPEHTARALKGLAEALTWLEIVGETVEKSEIAAAAGRALEFFAAHDFESEQTALQILLDRARQGADAPPAIDLDTLIAQDPGAVAKEKGAHYALNAFSNAAQLLLDRNPQAAWEIARKLRPLVREINQEKFTDSHYLLELRSFCQAYGPLAPLTPPTEPLETLARQCRAEAKKRKWSGEALAASLLGIALFGPSVDQEDAAIPILAEARECAPGGFLSQIDEALGHLEQGMRIGLAVNAVNAGDMDGALTHYATGLRGALDTGSTFQVLNMMRRINDLLPHAGDAGRMQVIATLAERGIAIELLGGPSATELVQVACRLCQANMSAKGSMNPVELAILWQVAKGFRFAATVRAGIRYDWQTDDEGRALLSRIEELSARLPPETPDDSPLDEEMLMAGYTGPGDRAAGDSPHEVVDNLRHRHDALVNRRLQSDLHIDIDFFLTPDRISAALDERSVLVSYFVGPSPRGALAFYILLATREDYEITMGEGTFPWSTIRLGSNGRQAEVNPIALLCSGIRSNIMDNDPYPRNVTPDAVKSLESVRQMAFGGHLPDRLAALRAAGKDHLCIVLHGPLHYVPFHLMGEADTPLANDWIVTYLPNLSLLARPDGAGKGGKRAKMAAFGLDFSDGAFHEGVPPLPNAPQEARAVAANFRTKALVNDAATESAFLAALSKARYVHVATHGRHRVVAPGFQQILLAPDAKSDGVLHAYEVLRLDLRHVDVISLSACETALGRFDSADNIRGLPASFLIAGAATVIGTLWPVQTDASECFFTRLYERLRAGDGKLDAFRAAQVAARAAFPNYRDWGAFHFVGGI